MKLVFVSGKYQADTEAGITANIKHAEREAKRLWEMGYSVITPHLNTAYFTGDRGMYLQGCLEMVRRCDSIYMLKGFRQSYGAMDEYNLAKQLGKVIIYEE